MTEKPPAGLCHNGSPECELALNAFCPKSQDMIRHTLISALLVYGLSAGVTAAQSQQVVSLEVLPGWRTADGTHIAALKIQLAPGWKTYWRAPGDAGIPPMIDWSGSENLVKMMPLWPTPEVFSQNGMNSVGYKKELVLPVVLTPQDAKRPISLSGAMQIGICNDICVPADLDFDMTLPLARVRDATISAALTNQPYSAAKAGVGRVSCDISLSSDGVALSATLEMPPTGAFEYAIVETADPEIWVAEAQTQRDGNTLTVQTELMQMYGDSFVLDRSGLRVTVLGSEHAVDIQGCSPN
jgi:DsbC/DsbD-like thiol-disulfide interchange protein